MKKKLKDYSYILFLFLFFLLWYGVVHEWFVSIDLSIYAFSQTFLSDGFTLFMKGITFLASPIWLLLLLFITFFIVKQNQSRVYLLLVMAFDVTMNWILKNWIQRPRPNFHHLVTENSFSFPSGHAMGSVAFYGVLLLLLWESKYSLKKKWFWTIFLLLLIVLINFSRIYLGVHYFSDVLAGVVLSLFILGFAKAMLKKL